MAEDATTVGGSDLEVARNRTFGAGIVDNPYPVMHELRGACPVQAVGIAENYPGMEGLRPLVPTDMQTYSTYSYDAALEVLRRPGEFASEPFYAQLSASIGRSVLGMDEPEHRRMRMLVQPAFAKQEMERWKERIIRPIVDGHFDRIAPLGRCRHLPGDRCDRAGAHHRRGDRSAGQRPRAFLRMGRHHDPRHGNARGPLRSLPSVG